MFFCSLFFYMRNEVKTMDIIRPVFMSMTQSKMFQLLAVFIVMDIIFGCLRAIKEKTFNSSVGINGMIRKAGMCAALICMAWVDNIICLNLIGFIPQAVRDYLPLETIGTMDFFAVIFCIYEVLSILKNMTLCGLPVQKIWDAVRKFLKDNTSEIIDIEEVDDDEQKL